MVQEIKGETDMKRILWMVLVVVLCGESMALDWFWKGKESKGKTEKMSAGKMKAGEGSPEFRYIFFRKDSGQILTSGASCTYTINEVRIGDGVASVINWDIMGLGSTSNFTSEVTNTNQLTDVVVIDVVAKDNQRKQMLATVIAMYKDFLKTEWTTILRTKGIIGPDVEITATNTSEAQNIQYIMTLRAMDSEPNKPTYSYYKGEFETFKSTIVSYGGDMGNLK